MLKRTVWLGAVLAGLALTTSVAHSSWLSEREAAGPLADYLWPTEEDAAGGESLRIDDSFRAPAQRAAHGQLMADYLWPSEEDECVSTGYFGAMNYRAQT